MPRPDYILWFLGTFVALWAASVVVRGLGGRRKRRRCPSCRRDLPAAEGLRCGGCGYEAAQERELLAARPHWPTVAVGAAGLAFAPAVFWYGFFVHTWMEQRDTPGAPGPWTAAAAGTAVFGLALAMWAWRGERSRGRRRCPKCWYDMSGAQGERRCSECGHEARRVRDLYRARRRRTTAAAGVALVVLSVVPYEYPRVRSGGWVAAVPTTAMIAGLPWLPEEAASQFKGRGSSYSLLARVQQRSLWGWQRMVLKWRVRGMADSRDWLEMSRAAVFAAVIDSGMLSEAPFRRAQERAIEVLLSDGAEAQRVGAGQALAAVAPYRWREPAIVVDAAMVERLVDCLGEDSDASVAGACSLLIWAGSGAAPAVPRLVELLGSPSRTRASCAFSTLASLVTSCPEVDVEAKAAVVKAQPLVAMKAMTLLLRGGDDDTQTERFLREQLDRGSDNTAASILEGLMWAGMGGTQVQPEDLVRVAVARLETANARLDVFARMLKQQPVHAAAVTDRVVALLQSENLDRRVNATDVLAEIARTMGTDLRSAVPAMLALHGELVRRGPEVAGEAEMVRAAIVDIENVANAANPEPGSE
jgi:hypothetical protein